MHQRSILAGTVVLGLLCSLGLEAQQSDSSASNNTNLPASSQSAAGTVPRLIKLAGEINPQITQIALMKQSEGGKNPLPTVVGATFSLYELQEGGSPLWSESQKVQVDERGHYSVLLGSTQPEGLPLDLFSTGKALWVGVQPQLPGQAEQPRVLLVAVPYSLKSSDADTLGGLPASAYALAGSATLVTPAAGANPSSSSAAAQSSNPSTGGPVPGPPPPGPCKSLTADGSAFPRQVALYSAPCALTEDTQFVDVAGKVGIGTTTPLSPLHVVGNFGSKAANQYAVNVASNWTPTANDPTYAALGMNFLAGKFGAFNSTAGIGVGGVEGMSHNAGSGNVTGAAGMVGGVENAGTGTITNAYGNYLFSPIAAAGSPITNGYGIYINSQKATGVTNGYGIYATGANDINYLAGSVGIGTSTPTGMLEVNGTAKFDGLVTFKSGQTFPGTGTITGITTASGSGLTGGGTSGTLSLAVDTTVARTNASNGFSGNQTVTGTLAATSFTGSGAGLTNLTAANISAGTAGISITGNAAIATTAASATTAGNAANLGGVGAANYARLDIGNSFTGNQSVSGNVSATGSVSGGTASFTGALTAADGALLPATGTATASAGANSEPLDLLASSFSSTTTTALNQHFRWQVEPADNNTASPSGTLNLLYLSGTGTPAETGLSIASNGHISFASGQTFPGGGTGTITGVTAGIGLSGGGTSGTVTLNNTGVLSVGTTAGSGILVGGTAANPSLSADSTVLATNTSVTSAVSGGVTMAESYANGTFLPLAGGTLTGALSGTSATFTGGDVQITNGNLDLPATVASRAGVINLNGAPFLHSCCSSANTWIGGAGNFTTTGNVNTGSGADALHNNTAGYFNTASGADALYSNAAGSNNTANGINALFYNDAGSNDVAVGNCSLYNTTRSGASGSCSASTPGQADANTAIGTLAGLTNTTGNGNTFVGFGADAASGALSNATAIGANAHVSESNALVLGAAGTMVGIGLSAPAHTLDVAGDINTSGHFIGDGSMLSNVTTTSLSCTACVGNTQLAINYAASASQGGYAVNSLELNGFSSSAFAMLSGPNTFSATQTISSGDLSVSSGDVDLPQTTSASVGAFKMNGQPFIHACCSAAQDNTFLGALAGTPVTSGYYNTGTGYGALHSNTSGGANTANGTSALYSNKQGQFNTASGVNTLYDNSGGNNNVAIGASALFFDDQGSNNVAMGNCSLYNTTRSGSGGSCSAAAPATADANTALGTLAGYSNTTGNLNTFVGFQANAGGVAAGSLTNATAIGANALVSASNSLVLGAGANVGIGTTTPLTALDVEGENGVLKFDPNEVLNGILLTITGAGAMIFSNEVGGDILRGGGAAGIVFRVSGTGEVFADGGYQTSGADFAESVAAQGQRSQYEPGDVLEIDPRADRRLALSRHAYSTLVAGIYSTKPGVLATPRAMNDPEIMNSEVPLAVVGIVPCKVTAENGPIARGDLLVTSSKPGYAMKGTDRSQMLGAVVGKAFEPLPKGTGVIPVLVTLQ